MKCEKCQSKTATSHVVSIVNGKKEEHHYCTECMVGDSPLGQIISGIEKHINNYYDIDADYSYENDELDENGVPFEYSSEEYENENIVPFELIDGIVRLATKEVLENSKVEKSAPENQGSEPLVICPSCGMTSQSIRKTFKAGCAECYNIFENVLMERYRMYYGGHQAYQGKVYGKNGNGDIDYLEKELSTAVKNQNYERAAEIRDNIKKLQIVKSKNTKKKKCKRGEVE